MDFGDLLLHMTELMRDRADILAQYHRMFRYILVDEYRDTNLVSRFANTDQIPCLPDPRKDGSDWAASGALAAALPPIPGIRFLVGNCDSGH